MLSTLASLSVITPFDVDKTDEFEDTILDAWPKNKGPLPRDWQHNIIRGSK